MTAVVLRQHQYGLPESDDNLDHMQDDETGEFVRDWQPQTVPGPASTTQKKSIRCIVRGIIDGGIRVAGTTEKWTGTGQMESIDYAKMQFPANENVSSRDRITEIRGPNGKVIWAEEEFTGAPSVFEVLGVTPVVDPFGMHIENMALLKRAKDQQNG